MTGRNAGGAEEGQDGGTTYSDRTSQEHAPSIVTVLPHDVQYVSLAAFLGGVL